MDSVFTGMIGEQYHIFVRVYDEGEKMAMYNNTCSNCGKKFATLSEDEMLCGECRKMKNARAEREQINVDTDEGTGIDGGRLYQFEDAYREEFEAQEKRVKRKKALKIAGLSLALAAVIGLLILTFMSYFS